jgi:serine O-acetyltransferase
VGIPARIILPKDGPAGDAAMATPRFSAYGITPDGDPIGEAMRGLIDSASSQEHQIALLWQAIEKLSANGSGKDCVPVEAALECTFEADKLTQLMGK